MADAIKDAGGIDLNSASEEELEQVGGLGHERAERIIHSRPINSWEELEKVPGFSQTLINDLKKAGATLGRAA